MPLSTNTIIIIAAIAGAAIILFIALFAMIKTANGNEALVVSGVGATDKNGNPTIKTGRSPTARTFLLRKACRELSAIFLIRTTRT